MNGVIRGRCPRCGGKIIYSEFYQNARDYTIRKDGKVPKRYVSRSGELSESVAACENGCGAYWEDEDFSIGQDGMFYDNKYTEDSAGKLKEAMKKSGVSALEVAGVCERFAKIARATLDELPDGNKEEEHDD